MKRKNLWEKRKTCKQQGENIYGQISMMLLDILQKKFLLLRLTYISFRLTAAK